MLKKYQVTWTVTDEHVVEVITEGDTEEACRKKAEWMARCRQLPSARVKPVRTQMIDSKTIRIIAEDERQEEIPEDRVWLDKSV